MSKADVETDTVSEAEVPTGIAIIGMAGRFPGARDVDAFWRNLREGVESIARLTDAQLQAAGVSESQRRNPRYVAARGLLEGVDLFDAGFFQYSPREAELIDPQQRLFLECAWEALENAGYEAGRFPGPIGLFAGAGGAGYLLHHVAPQSDTSELLESLGSVLGNDKDHLTTRVAYKLNFRGPVITVQTACSTSLVTVQLACQALLDFQCDMALAGGVSIAFPLGTGYLPQEGHILSPDGHCRSFDARAQGTVPADGVGLVVLKRLEDALADGDTIRAVILGAAVNNDGSSKVGYTAPSIDGQAEVIQMAQALAGVEPGSISYIEAHGTGTALGDAIEIAALKQAFRRAPRGKGFCAIGSVKSNFGHLNTAAGVASLIKTTLALENRILPPSLHFQGNDPKTGLEDSPFTVNSTATEWRAGASRRRAGVSAFAMGGTNAHAVLEEAPLRTPGSPAKPCQLLVLSARTDAALDAMKQRLHAHLNAHPEAELADVAYTLQVGRRAFPHRFAVACRDAGAALQALQASLGTTTQAVPETERSVAFLFPDEGLEHLGEAEALYRTEAVFREEVDRCTRLLQSQHGLRLPGLFSGDVKTWEPVLAQAALFTVGHALARWWMALGVRPAALLGQGPGEAVAACLAEVFTLEEALALVVARGRWMQGVPEGSRDEALAQNVRRLHPKPPRLPLLSPRTGARVTEAQATQPEHWSSPPRPPVSLTEGLATLEREGHLLLRLPFSPERGASALEGVWSAMGQLWTAGVPIQWSALHAGQRRYRVPLPTYPFERRRHWLGRAVEAPSLDTLEETLRQELGIPSLESHPGLVEGLKALCSSHLCAYLQANGIATHPGAAHDRRALRERLGIQPRFHRLFDAMVAGLAEDGILQLQGEELRFLRDGAALESPVLLRQRLDAAHPRFQGLFDFVEHCLGSYDPALRGKVEAISVLYPGGSAQFLQQCKARTAEHSHERIYLQVLQEALRRLALSTQGRRLRILELGGGQGLLTWPALAALRDFGIEYHFTDLGRVFVEDARQEAARRGLGGVMRFGVLDISRAPQEQGYEEGTFDAVIAYNVVHATRDVRQSLQNAGRLLRPGGLLGLVEAVRLSRWEVLSWGLAEGWWYFDDGLRTDSPLLPLSGWEEALKPLDFEALELFPRSEAVREQVDHGLVLARRREARTFTQETPAPPRPAPVEASSSAPHPRPPMAVAYVAPRTGLEQRIAGICEELLGVAPVGVHDDFVALGGDSLIVLRLVDRLEQELGQAMPTGAAFSGLTVERLARAVEGTARPEESSLLVPLQTAGTKPPLFFVHPAAGVAFPYFELARQLGPDQPFYGLQAMGLDGESPPDECIEDMARHYIEAMRSIQPRGPYFIGGFSFGCLVAYEIAQQLTAADEQIGLLVMVDEPAPLKGHRPTPLEMTRFLTTGVARSIWPHLHDYFYLVNAARKRQGKGLPRNFKIPPRMLETFLARSALANFVPPDSRVLALRQAAILPMFQLFLIHVRETFAYEPKAYPHRVTLFSTDEVRSTRGRKDPLMGWDKLAAGGVDVHEVPGNHLSLLKAPHVQIFARKLSACLAQTQSSPQAKRPHPIARESHA
ncbi:beta-ketoacyl synthase N-terminal-like domain-containing protein [Stigmatella sp. ncwal1]|uniref:Beta-ketoacyl synthase N-terminal-like domain-containing protein n=1 Tax=Stigmatella ashevillensis TaxID=2995309 RepID=A0ABT5DHQ6_9BACT|nr:type I polyketide synthase [Stigmatella ashevillena]MDC0711872.1 beta-ketoacyl synthase N-terminal-like domain-containing protein [Stigmatella ashevillena]